VLGLLGERCPRRVAAGAVAALHPFEAPSSARDEEEIPFEALLDRAIVDGPDVLVLPGLERSGRATAARDQATRRVVIATFTPALDACAAVESLGRAGTGPLLRELLVGILAARLMESLCASCQRPVDPFEFLPPAARHRRPPAGSYAVSEGCPSCRGSGILLWQPVYEFLSCLPPEDPFRPRRPARELRDDRATRGLKTLSLTGFARAATGIVDVREPLRLLLHEG